MRAGQLATHRGRCSCTARRLGLLGFGGIAGEVARIMGGAGMRVIAWNRTKREAPGVEFVGLDQLLAESDVLSLHLLLTDETRGFLGADRLAQLRPSTILVNTARGAIVDESALIEALRAGRTCPTPRWMCSTRSRCPPSIPFTELERM